MKPITAALALLALAGCATAPAPVAPAAPAADTVTVVGTIQPTDTTGYLLLGLGPTTDLVTPNDLAHLNAGAIEVWLKRGADAAVQVGDDLPGSARSFTLNNLRKDTSYTVLLKAFKDDPNVPGDAATLAIADEEASTTTFDTNANAQGAHDTVLQKSFKLKLKDYTFAGEAQGGIQVEEGDFDSTEEPEGLKAPKD